MGAKRMVFRHMGAIKLTMAGLMVPISSIVGLLILHIYHILLFVRGEKVLRLQVFSFIP